MSKPESTKAVIADLQSRVDELEERLAALEQYTPEARRLTLDEVTAIIEESPFAEFDVLYDFRGGSRQFHAGQPVRADMVDRLPDYVRSGLALAVPRTASSSAKEAMSLAAAQRELAQAEAEAARALAAKLQVAGALDSLAS